MAVISVTVEESVLQIVAGIPKTITISTNISSIIFYTLDGSDPDTNSLIYTEPLKLPTDQALLTLKIFATNGIDNSPIISNIYEMEFMNSRAHSGTDDVPNSPNLNSRFPFGSGSNQTPAVYTGAQNAGVNGYDPALPATNNMYDADGEPDGYTNVFFEGIASPDLQVRLSDSDYTGKPWDFIGTIPKSTIEQKIAPKEITNTSDKLFDPKASVIVQDFTKSMPEDRDFINKQFFSLEDFDTTRNGKLRMAVDSPPITGSFVRNHYNPKDRTMTYYYFDSAACRWIISKMPFTPKPEMYNYSGVVFAGRNNGDQYVRYWVPFSRRYLI